MPSIFEDIIQHRLNVNPKRKQVHQRRRVFAPKRNKAILDKVDKLLAANFIREVYYPDWFANVVMVKRQKENGECVDFSDLNSAYLKDSFPLSRIY